MNVLNRKVVERLRRQTERMLAEYQKKRRAVRRFTRPFPFPRMWEMPPLTIEQRMAMWTWIKEQVQAGAISVRRYRLLVEMDFNLSCCESAEEHGQWPSRP